MKNMRIIFIIGFIVSIVSCGGSGGSAQPSSEEDAYQIGGSVSGLSGSGLTIQNNLGDSLVISNNGPFTFSAELVEGDGYDVSILTNPTLRSQTCTVSNATGTVSDFNISDVDIVCVTNQYDVSLTVSGLSGEGLVLQNNGFDDLPIANDGGYTFSRSVLSGEEFSVSILSDPTGPIQDCSVNNANGTITDDDAQVAVTCVSRLGRFAYVLNNRNGRNSNISMYTFANNTEQLRHNGYVLTGGNNSIKISADGRGLFVYTLNRDGSVGESSISAFAIDQTNGKLNSLVDVPYDTRGLDSSDFAISPLGRHLYTVNQASDDISIFLLEESRGDLTYVGSIQSGGDDPINIEIDPSGRYVYVANTNSSDISAFLVEADGTLSPIDADANTQGMQNTIAIEGGGVSSLTIDKSGRNLYAVDIDTRTITTFLVNNSTGSLVQVDSFATRLSAPFELTIDNSSEYAYISFSSSDMVNAYSIDQFSGVLSPIGRPLDTNDEPISVNIDPSGQYLYVTNALANDISIFDVNNQNGRLSSLGLVNTRETPIDMVITQGNDVVQYSSDYAYITSEGTNSIEKLTIDSDTGELSVSTNQFRTDAGPVAMAIDSLKRFAYVAHRGNNTISQFAIDTAGDLTRLSVPSISTNYNAIDIKIEASARFVYALTGNAITGDSFVVPYRINQNSGELAIISPPINAGSFSLGLTIDPTGRFIYVSNLNGGISQFRIDLAGGLIQPIGNLVGAGYLFVSSEIDPNGQFLYAIDRGSDSIVSYSIDNITGELTEIGTPVSGSGSNMIDLTIEPSGRYLYAANEGSDDVLTFSIDQVTGMLNEEGAPTAANVNPVSITTDLSGRYGYVVNKNSNDLTTFGINLNTGELSEIGTEVLLNSTPSAIAITGSLN